MASLTALASARGRSILVLLLLLGRTSCQVPSPRPTFEFNNEKAFKSSDVDDIDDNVLVVRSRKRATECFTGSEMYEDSRVFCDQLCRRYESGREDVSRQSGRGKNSRDEKELCNGPWYCSRTEICETFHNSDPDSDRSSRKSCMVVRSCANHSHCFPNDMDASNMNIVFNRTAQQIENDGFKAYYGGMSFTTTCCSNRENYRPGIDTPCNRASHHSRGLRSLIVGTSLLTTLLVMAI